MVSIDFKKLLDAPEHIGELKLLTAQLEGADPTTLRQMVDQFRQRYPQQAVIVLASVLDSDPILVVGVTDDLNKQGIRAGDLVNLVATAVGGRGGGRPSLAQAGGGDPAKIPQAMKLVSGWLAERLQ